MSVPQEEKQILPDSVLAYCKGAFLQYEDQGVLCRLSLGVTRAVGRPVFKPLDKAR